MWSNRLLSPLNSDFVVLFLEIKFIILEVFFPLAFLKLLELLHLA